MLEGVNGVKYVVKRQICPMRFCLSFTVSQHPALLNPNTLLPAGPTGQRRSSRPRPSHGHPGAGPATRPSAQRQGHPAAGRGGVAWCRAVRGWSATSAVAAWPTASDRGRTRQPAASAPRGGHGVQRHDAGPRGGGSARGCEGTDMDDESSACCLLLLASAASCL